MVNRNITGAHYGLKDWLVQRVTAVVMAVYTIIFGVVYFVTCPQDYFAWSYIFQSQWMRIITLVFFLSLFWHAWIGVRDIYMDYIKRTRCAVFSVYNDISPDCVCGVDDSNFVECVNVVSD